MYKTTITLKQHTPIIHFQHDQEGATLRATELKPKLDRYLLEKMDLKEALKKGWARKQSNGKISLDYKVMIKSFDKKPIKSDVVIIPPDRKIAISNKKIEVHFFSMHKDLSDFFEERAIAAFFSSHNFGTRQNKGWGSFFPANSSVNDFEAALKRSNCVCYKYQKDIPGDNFERTYRNIISRDIWGILKSGKNFNGYQKSLLFKFAANKEMRWEKRAIKKALVRMIDRNQLPANLWAKRPPVKEPVDVNLSEGKCETNTDRYFSWEDNPDHDFNYFFIRLLLGMPEHYEFRATQGYTYQVIPKSATIERLKAPVTFKVFERKLYAIIRKTPFPENLFKSKHEFGFWVQKKKNNNKQGDKINMNLTLSPPESFYLEEFLDEYLPCVRFTKMK